MEGGWIQEEGDEEVWHHTAALFTTDHQCVPLLHGLTQSAVDSDNDEGPDDGRGEPMHLFEGAWLLALPYAGFSREEPYRQLHADD